MGYIGSQRLKERCKTLSFLLDFITELRDVMRYTNAPVREMLNSIIRKNDNCCDIKKAFDGQSQFDNGFQKLINGFYNQKKLTKQDIESVRGFGQKIGKTDLEGQLSSCEYYISRVNGQLEIAKSEEEKRSRLYLTSGILSGLALSLFVI